MKKPNIIYILADDLGYGDLSCYGANRIKTPILDELAAGGMLFSDAHAPSAVCTPTRYGVLTGRYSWRSRLKEGVIGGYCNPLIEKERLTVPTFLRQHGYATSAIGKWHLGLKWEKVNGEIDYSQPIEHGPTDLGFDYFFGVSASLDMPPYCFIENNQTVGIPSVKKDPIDFSQRGRGGLMTPGWKDEEVNSVLTNKAVTQIEEHVQNKSEQPFFMYFALTGPHTPWLPAEQFKEKSGIGPRGDLIVELDWTVGEIVKTLKKLGVWENTLLVFTSDNGPRPKTEEVTIHGHKPVGDLRGEKADIWDGGHRVPFIASWPKVIQPGTVTDDLICLLDLLGTCADIIDTPLPEKAGEDTLSILPIFNGGDSVRKSVVHHSYTGMYSIRSGDWKLILGKGSGGFVGLLENPQISGFPISGAFKTDNAPGQLYQMKGDVSETENVYLKYPEIVQRLTTELIEIINSGDNYEVQIKK